MGPIKNCADHSKDMESGGFEVTSVINNNTTPEEFESLIRKVDNYQLENGGRCGFNAIGTASYYGNLNLVQHILTKGNVRLLNLGNRFGWTPLFCAAMSKIPKDNVLIAYELLRQGADPNLATSNETSDGIDEIPKGVTPLWAAAEIIKDKILIRLLLEYGALTPTQLSEEGKDLLSKVQ